MSDYEDDWGALVVDNGSCYLRAGYAGMDEPKIVVPSVIATKVDQQTSKPTLSTSLKYVMKHGIINSMEDIETIWYHMFYNELKDNPSERNVLLSDPILNPISNKQLMLQVMFETFQVPAMYITNQCVLALYASGRITGIVLSVGDAVLQTVPVYEGHAIPSACTRRDFAGGQITNYLMELLKVKGYCFSTSMEREIVRDVKEKHCYVAMDYEKEFDIVNKDTQQQYKLPDGNVINIDTERFKCAEMLFQPQLYNINSIGVHELLYQSIMQCDMDTRRDMYGNIVICGGTTYLSGFPERIHQEVKNISNVPFKVKIVAPPERNSSVWIGGSILSSLSTFQDCWITEDMYDEYGADAMYIKTAYGAGNL